jgi:hypothetical protein
MWIYLLLGISIAVIGIIGLSMPGKFLSRFPSILAIAVGAGVILVAGQHNLQLIQPYKDSAKAKALWDGARRKRRQK